MDKRHRFRAVAELLRPFERRVAAPDDDDTLASELLRIGHAIEDSTSVPGLRAGLWETSRREGADPPGDDDRTRWEPIGLGDKDEVTVVLLESGDVLVQVRFEGTLRRMLAERVDQILCQDLGKSPDVE